MEALGCGEPTAATPPSTHLNLYVTVARPDCIVPSTCGFRVMLKVTFSRESRTGNTASAVPSITSNDSAGHSSLIVTAYAGAPPRFIT